MDKKVDVPGFYKTGEGVIVNKDGDALKAYKAQKARNSKLNTMEDKVSALEKDIAEIKELLTRIVK